MMQEVYIAYVCDNIDSPSRVEKIINGMKIYLKNNKKHLFNKRIVVNTYETKGVAEQTVKIAEKIVRDKKIVAVVSSMSSQDIKRTMSIYEKGKIPFLMLSATNTQLINKHDYSNFFRIIYNDTKQANYMCLYASEILKYKKIAIVYSHSLYGEGLKDELIKYAKTFGLQACETIAYNELHKLAKVPKDCLVCLALDERDIQSVLKTLKEKYAQYALFGSDTISGFYKNRDELLKNAKLYMVMPFMFELGDYRSNKLREEYRKNFKNDPDWHVVFGYESMRVLDKCLNDVDLSAGMLIKREQLIKALKAGKHEQNASKFFKQENSIVDLRFYDHEADTHVRLGMAEKTHIKALNTQCRHVKNDIYFTNKNALIKENALIEVSPTETFYRKHIVFTGMYVNAIRNLDIRKGTCLIDFYLWLRHHSSLKDADGLVFLNALRKIDLKDASKGNDVRKHVSVTNYGDEETFIQLIRSTVKDQQTYKLFRIKSFFRLNAKNPLVPKFYRKNHTISISFRHNTLDSNFIKYVNDTDEQREYNNINSSKSMLEAAGWHIIGFNLFADTMKLTSFGNPDYIASIKELVFSRYNVQFDIEQTGFYIFDFISFEFAQVLLVICLICSVIIESLKMRYKNSGLLALLGLLSHIPILLSLNKIFLDIFGTGDIYKRYMFEINFVFDAIWWILIARAAICMLEVTLWEYMRKKTKRKVPNLLKICTSLMIYMFMLFAIIAFVLDMPITSLLASTSLLAFLVIMAVQMNVSHIFSGIFLNIEGKFRPGDYVAVDGIKGIVVSIGWRSTTIKTGDHNMMNIPNSMMAHAKIGNFNYPESQYDLKLSVSVSLQYDPKFISEVLVRAVKLDRAVKDVHVIVEKYEGNIAIYQIVVSVVKYSDQIDENMRTSVYRNIWKYFERMGINPGLRKSSEVHVYDMNAVQEQLQFAQIIDKHTGLKLLTQAQQVQIAKQSEIRDYKVNDKVLLEDCMGFVIEGVICKKGKILQQVNVLQAGLEHIVLKPSKMLVVKQKLISDLQKKNKRFQELVQIEE